MFTGIVQWLGKIMAVEPNDFGARLTVDTAGWGHHPAAGDSISVNGCCLTAREAPPDASPLEFDVIRQSLARTNLGDLQPGDPVNLEHAATPSTLLGGHIVQGHVDGVGVIRHVASGGEEWRVRVEPPAELQPFIVERGSIAIDGVSLTLAAVDERWFEVALIPTTLERTTLRRAATGRRVNLEADYLARIVVNWLERTPTRTTGG